MMTLALSILGLFVLTLTIFAYRIVTRRGDLRRELQLSDENLAPAMQSAPQLDRFQLDRFNQRNFNRWLKARYKTSEKTGVRAWLSSKIGKIRAELATTLVELKKQRTRRGGKHSLAYFRPLTPQEKRRAARMRRAAIKKSGEFIETMRTAKGLVPVVRTARQLQKDGQLSLDHRGDVLPKGHGSDRILWREVKASA